MSESHFTGPGEVILAPDIWGDIVPIPLDGRVQWKVGKHSYLASTQGVVITHKSQGIMKGLCMYSDNLLLLCAHPTGLFHFSLRRRYIRARGVRAGYHFRPVHGRNRPKTATRG